MARSLLNILVALILAIPLYFLVKVRPDDTFINTLYTSASIMFSIGMGVICTFNPEKIKNKKIYASIKRKVLHLRSSFLWHFGCITAGYVSLQVIGDGLTINVLKTMIDMTLAVRIFYIMLLILSMCYFIYNFLSMQKLTFKIHESD